MLLFPEKRERSAVQLDQNETSLSRRFSPSCPGAYRCRVNFDAGVLRPLWLSGAAAGRHTHQATSHCNIQQGTLDEDQLAATVELIDTIQFPACAGADSSANAGSIECCSKYGVGNNRAWVLTEFKLHLHSPKVSILG
jgi:hypothetical protein